ncbi:MAG: hypothetical protein EOQ69_03310 [Mesorhizobium sp.]|nr:MAG: hypothetical protein EOQ69_03310 [Mesorhizobium sp.]RWK34863.1 MAG: hypothetical protein EOR44_06025 [Mesorhizobium sp.]
MAFSLTCVAEPGQILRAYPQPSGLRRIAGSSFGGKAGFPKEQDGKLTPKSVFAGAVVLVGGAFGRFFHVLTIC